jgi:hypothetical protein
MILHGFHKKLLSSSVPLWVYFSVISSRLHQAQGKHGKVTMVDQVNLSFFERALNKLPGGQKYKVFWGTALTMGFLGATFFGGQSKKAGHGAFDLDKPQAVQEGQDAQEDARLSRFVSSSKKNRE